MQFGNIDVTNLAINSLNIELTRVYGAIPSTIATKGTSIYVMYTGDNTVKTLTLPQSALLQVGHVIFVINRAQLYSTGTYTNTTVGYTKIKSYVSDIINWSISMGTLLNEQNTIFLYEDAELAKCTLVEKIGNTGCWSVFSQGSRGYWGSPGTAGISGYSGYSGFSGH